MSYTGNSKEAIVQLGQVDADLLSLRTDLTAETNNRVSDVASLVSNLAIEVNSRVSDVAGLRTDLNSEINNRVSAVATVQNNLNVETASRVAETTQLTNDLNNEVSNRQAQDTSLNNKIDAREAVIMGIMNNAVSTINASIATEQSARATADTNLNNSLTTLSNRHEALATQEQSRYISTNGRLNDLESGLSNQVQAMIQNNALDAVQSNLISQYAASLGAADSVIYERIAEKASILSNNAFREKFNGYLHDWFEAYTLNINSVAKTAADYQIAAEVSVNSDPSLVAAAVYTELLSTALTGDSSPSPYVAYASSILGYDYQAYKCFNKIKGKADDNFGWHSNTFNYPEEYNYSAGLSTGQTIINGVVQYGEWIEIGNTVSAFDNVKEVVLYGSSTLVDQRFPKRILVCGSNDRSSWTKMMDSNEALNGSINYTQDSNYITNTQRLLINHASNYKYLRLIITQMRARDYPMLIEVEYKK